MNTVDKKFGERVRVRVNGLLIKDNEILLIQHRGLGTKGKLWSPPGGGVDFGEKIEEALRREFKEETGIEVKQARFKFIHEFISPPLHAIELFYEILEAKGDPLKGKDPELSEEEQLIERVKYVSFEDLHIMDNAIKHEILKGKISKELLISSEGKWK